MYIIIFTHSCAYLALLVFATPTAAGGADGPHSLLLVLLHLGLEVLDVYQVGLLLCLSRAQLQLQSLLLLLQQVELGLQLSHLLLETANKEGDQTVNSHVIRNVFKTVVVNAQVLFTVHSSGFSYLPFFTWCNRKQC